MPWLIATAAPGIARTVVEKRDALKGWTILLAILAFGFSLIGTFLVRSGVITSVHAFAQDPSRGRLHPRHSRRGARRLLRPFFSPGGRSPRCNRGGLFAPISREGALVLNNLLLGVATGTVLLGTLYPLALSVITGGTVLGRCTLLHRDLRAADGCRWCLLMAIER